MQAKSYLRPLLTPSVNFEVERLTMVSQLVGERSELGWLSCERSEPQAASEAASEASPKLRAGFASDEAIPSLVPGDRFIGFQPPRGDNGCR